MKEKLSEYKNKKVLITGGAGFIGSNLAHKLVLLGAEVVILDSLHPLYGGNLFNIEDIKERVNFVKGDIRDEKLVNELVKNKDIIFNLAAQVSYIDSLNMPYEDLDVSCKGHMTILEACRNNNRNARIIFASSRMVLGKIEQNPVTENHPINPMSLYGIHKFVGEKYHLLYNKEFGIPVTILRITNPYGDRQQIKHSKYSLPGWFMRLAMEGKTIKIFGDGSQLRDYVYIGDLTEAFLLIALEKKANGQVFNCGSGNIYKFRDMVDLVVKLVGNGNVKYVPWPDNYEKNETGDFVTDVSKLKEFIDWEPKVSLEEGIRMMIEYYKKNKDKYI